MPFVGCCALVYFWTLRFSRIGDFYTLRLGFFGNLDLRIIYEVTDGSAIDDVEIQEGEVVRTQYYTLQGVEVTYPSVSGLYIVKKTFDTKQIITEKVFITVK